MHRPPVIYKRSASRWPREGGITVSRTIMAEGGVAPKAGEGGSVYIVYTERPEGDDHEAHHVRTVASVVGSEEAAKQAILYVYKNAAVGFSAKLTPEQVEEMSSKGFPVISQSG
ncbi:hypothetical protein ACLOJK_001145 [Asimina triloba]